MGFQRSPEEIRFRLRQELMNFRYFLAPPKIPEGLTLEPPALPPEPGDPAEWRQIADEILQHRFPLLGGELATGEDIRWRRDYEAGLETDLVYFRRIPYLDAAKAGDHKKIWELNRHQHLALLAQVYRLTGEPKYLDEVVRELESWFAQNPFQRGINWTSALEVAFRALSWIRIDCLAGAQLPAGLRRRLMEGIHRHGLHLEINLSRYFSPNTHLLGEAVALHAIGLLYPRFPGAKRWETTGAEVVRNELIRQVLPDGCYFELSPYYHVYALDMFLFHVRLIGLDAQYAQVLTRMARFLEAVMGEPGMLPFIGDDDGGRFSHPFGERKYFGGATLAACREVLGVSGRQPESVRFPDCGLVVMSSGDVQVIVDAGSFGPGTAGHSHADTLSVIVRKGREEVLVDPGTYTYVGDPKWRAWFRGTAAHNTVRIDGSDQAIARGPFGWQSRPAVEVTAWESAAERDRLVAVCSYNGFRHEREVVFEKKQQQVTMNDRISGGEPGEHRVEQFWHFGSEEARKRVTFERPVKDVEGWISPAFGVKFPAPAVSVEVVGCLPLSPGVTRIDLS